MLVVAYAYQVIPGSDRILHFASNLRECEAAALVQRKELRREQEYASEELPAMALYRCTLRPPDGNTLMTVLNDEAELFKACVVDRSLVAFVDD